MYSDTRMKTPSGGIEESTSLEHAAFAPRWWIGNEAATASGRGQVLGETTLCEAAQWWGSRRLIPPDFAAAEACAERREPPEPPVVAGAGADGRAALPPELEAWLDECPQPAPNAVAATRASAVVTREDCPIWVPW